MNILIGILVVGVLGFIVWRLVATAKPSSKPSPGRGGSGEPTRSRDDNALT